MSINKRHIFYVPGYEPAGPVFYEKLFLRHLQRFTRKTKLLVKSTQSTSSEFSQRAKSEFESNSTGCSTLTYDILDHEAILKSHSNIARWKFYINLICLTPKVLRASLRKSNRHVNYASLVLFTPWLTFYIAVLLIYLISLILITSLPTIFGSSILSYSFVITIAIILFWLFDWTHQNYNISRTFNCERFFLHPRDPVQEKMSKRLDEFNEYICSNILLNESDEYIIVGHSLGSVLAARMVEKLINEPRLKKHIQERKVHLLCMGSIYQVELACQTHFNSRKEVYMPIRDCENLSWSEVYSAFDPFCPQPMNPCDMKLAPDSEFPQKPFFKSANFKKNLRSHKLNKLRKNLFLIHMQCILSSDTAETFDYFELITSKLPVTQYLKSKKTKTQ